MALRSLAS